MSDPRSDRAILLLARTTRGFGSGALSVVFALDLASAGYPAIVIGVLLGLALAAGAAWSLAAPALERRWSRRGVLLVGAAAFAAGGVGLALALPLPVAVVATLLLGGIAASGSDVSPLGSLEQAALADTTGGEGRTALFVLYNILGYVGAAVGALLAGPIAGLSPPSGGALGPGPHDAVYLLYAALGVGLVPAYAGLSRAPSRPPTPSSGGLSPVGRRRVLPLAGLFTLDAAAGGLVVNTFVAYVFVARYHPSIGALDGVFFAGNLAAGLSLGLALPLARRFGLVPTMVFTHLPSNVLLASLAFAPNFAAAAVLWVARSTLSQMDVPTRQSYVQAIVPPEDRTAAAGYTTAARSGQAVGGPVTGFLLSLGGPWTAAPFLLAGSLKSVYDLAVLARFRRLRPPEEEGDGDP